MQRILEAPDHLVEHYADAAGAHHSDHRGRADVGFEAVQREAEPKGQHLRNHAVGDLDQLVRPRGPDALDGPRVDRLDGLREQLCEDAGRVDEQRHHAGEGPEPDGDHEQDGEHHLMDGAEEVHQPSRRLQDPPRHHVVRGQDAEGDGEQDGQEGSPERDLDRDHHLLEIIVPVAEIRLEEARGVFGHVAGIGEEIGPAPHLRGAPTERQHCQQGREQEQVPQAA